MTETKFTPGPWDLEISDDDGFVIRMASAIEDPGFHDSNHMIEWDVCLYPDDGAQYEEALATARLITAAPEVFDALRLILPLAKGYAAQNQVGSNAEHIAAAEAAIAQVMGDR